MFLVLFNLLLIVAIIYGIFSQIVIPLFKGNKLFPFFRKTQKPKVSEFKKEVETTKEEILELKEREMAELERIASLTYDEAKNELLATVEEEIKHETAMLIKDLEQQAKEDADKKAR